MSGRAPEPSTTGARVPGGDRPPSAAGSGGSNATGGDRSPSVAATRAGGDAAEASAAISADQRCGWARGDPLLVAYHDLEWGRPLHDDRALFELLTLEGAQAGLSWMTVLRRRDGYRQAFDRFDIATVAAYDAADIDRLLADERIIRNRQKVASTIANARGVLHIQAEAGSFDAFVWSFVGGRPRLNTIRALADLPAQTAESVALSKALRQAGFGFVGPTICYAFMQAAGLVNDHLESCPARGPTLPRQSATHMPPGRS